MKSLLTLSFFFFTLSLFTQNLSLKTGTTRAVIIGISDYQDDGIPDLNYAHKDAEAFYTYLKSVAGGEVPDKNIKLLTNEKATQGQIGAALYWLMEVSKEGDKAIIYFSGHGDVENKTIVSMGYLLPYDCNSKIYMVGGLSLDALQAFVSTLTIKNKSEVILITDACRAGKLAGSSINGTQLTNANLAKQFSNEIRILSCQPDEFSLEGEQWGEGRGAFSYHLIDGLYGLADNNNDLNVKLLELGRYLEDKVTAETNPHSQIPMVVGNKGSIISYVDEATLAQRKKERQLEIPQLLTTDTKMAEDLYLANVTVQDSLLYKQFENQLIAGNLLEPAGNSAYDLYKQIIQNKELQPLHGTTRRNLAAALQDESQKSINAYLNANPVELKKRYEADSNYQQFPRYIEKAAEILGEENFFYPTLMANFHYFNGLKQRLDLDKDLDVDSLQYIEAINTQKQALSFRQYAPYILNELGVLYSKLKQDSIAFEYYEKAMKMAPQWGLPYVNYSLGLYYTNQIDSAIVVGEKAAELLGDFPEVYHFLAWINAQNFKWFDKTGWRRNGVDLTEDLQWDGGRQTSLTIQKRRLNKSIELLNRAIEKDTNFYNAYWGLSIINRNLKDYSTGIENLNKCIELKPRLLINYLSRGVMYTDLNFFEKSVDDFHKVIKIATTSNIMTSQDSIDLLGAYALLSGSYRMWRKYDESLEYGFRGKKLQDKLIDSGFSGFPACLMNISYSFRGKGDIENAVKYGIELIGEYGHFARTFGDTGALFFDFLNRYDDADWLFKHAIELNPEAFWIYTYLFRNFELHKKYYEGISFFSELKKKRPDDSNVSFCLGSLYMYTGEVELADIELENGIKNAVENGNSIGWIYHQFGYFEKAEKFYKITSESKTTSYTDFNLAVLYLHHKEYQKAKNQCEIGFQNFPSLTITEQLGIFCEYLLNPEVNIEEHFGDAETKYTGITKALKFLKFIESQDYTEAIKKWKEIPRTIVTWPIAYMYAGALAQVGELDAAVDVLETTFYGGIDYYTLTKDELLAPLQEHYRYKRFLRDVFPGKFDDTDEYTFDLPTPIYYPNNCIQLGKFYEKYEEWHRAEFLYHKALELNSELDSAYLALQELYQNHPEIKFEMDKPSLKAIIEAGEAEAIHHVALSNLYKYEGNESGAIERLKQAIAKSDKPQPIMLNLAKLYVKAQEKEEAEIVLDSLLKEERLSIAHIYPMTLLFQELNVENKVNQTLQKGIDLTKSPSYVYDAAKPFLDGKQPDLMQAFIQKGINKFPDDNGLFYNNACLYSLANQKAKALTQLEIAFQKGFKSQGDYKHMQTDSDLDNIRNTPEFKALLEKYFPEETKK